MYMTRRPISIEPGGHHIKKRGRTVPGDLGGHTRAEYMTTRLSAEHVVTCYLSI